MAYTFAMANGKKVGDSLCEPDKVELANLLLKKLEKKVFAFFQLTRLEPMHLILMQSH